MENVDQFYIEFNEFIKNRFTIKAKYASKSMFTRMTFNIVLYLKINKTSKMFNVTISEFHKSHVTMYQFNSSSYYFIRYYAIFMTFDLKNRLVNSRIWKKSNVTKFISFERNFFLNFALLHHYYFSIELFYSVSWSALWSLFQFIYFSMLLILAVAHDK